MLNFLVYLSSYIKITSRSCVYFTSSHGESPVYRADGHAPCPGRTGWWMIPHSAPLSPWQHVRHCTDVPRTLQEGRSPPHTSCWSVVSLPHTGPLVGLPCCWRSPQGMRRPSGRLLGLPSPRSWCAGHGCGLGLSSGRFWSMSGPPLIPPPLSRSSRLSRSRRVSAWALRCRH